MEVNIHPRFNVPLFLVTTVKDVENVWSEKFTYRTVGVMTTLDKAKEIVEGNKGDIFEFYYSFAVIEEIVSDVMYPLAKSKHWYKWNDSLRGYEACECPLKSDSYGAYAIG